MTESNLISDGILLMLIGMGTVFVFLSVLVFFTSMIHHLIGDEPKPKFVPPKSVSESDEIAAITAAVHTYRQKNTMNKEQ